MTLGNMRQLGVKRLLASCLNDACRHTALIDVSSYSAETEVPYFSRKVVCAKCGGRGNKNAAQLEGAAAASKPDREAMAMIFELAGLTISGINLALNLQKTYKDWSSWKEADVEVESDWIDVALEKGVIEGKKEDFGWMRLTKLPTAELRGTIQP
jgi:hypothetical protein